MTYLHKCGIVHRLLNLDNILLSVDQYGNLFDLKLSNFGQSVKLYSMDESPDATTFDNYSCMDVTGINHEKQTNSFLCNKL